MTPVQGFAVVMDGEVCYTAVDYRRIGFRQQGVYQVCPEKADAVDFCKLPWKDAKYRVVPVTVVETKVWEELTARLRAREEAHDVTSGSPTP